MTLIFVTKHSIFTFIDTAICSNSLAASSDLYFFGSCMRKYFSTPSKSI